MSFRNDRFEYRFATSADSSQILDIYESGSYNGQISVLFTRRPDPLHSLEQEGEQIIIPVMVDKQHNRIAGVGCCVLRNAWINGEVKKTAYLTGLKIHPDYQRRLPHISRVYEALYNHVKDQVDLFYTTILKDNVKAQKMLEKRRKGMPLYSSVGEYTVYSFRTGMKPRHHLGQFLVEKGSSEEVEAFYAKQLNQFNLAPADIRLPGISKQDIYTLRGENRQILAACALWNQQNVKQYIITGYRGFYRFLKYVPLKLFGYPNLPKENTPANYASIALLCARNNQPEWAQYLISQVAAVEDNYDFLMVGLFENNPLNKVFQQIRHIKYQSILYTVQWEKEPLLLDSRPTHLEVGLL